MCEQRLEPRGANNPYYLSGSEWLLCFLPVNLPFAIAVTSYLTFVYELCTCMCQFSPCGSQGSSPGHQAWQRLTTKGISLAHPQLLPSMLNPRGISLPPMCSDLSHGTQETPKEHSRVAMLTAAPSPVKHNLYPVPALASPETIEVSLADLLFLFLRPTGPLCPFTCDCLVH